MSSDQVNSNPIWVVVPDGLAADANGHALPAPSFVYLAVLDWIARHAGDQDHICLAPANDFGGSITEQEAGRRYLNGRTRAAITCAPSSGRRYIDTRGNACQLRAELERQGRWPLAAVHLVSYAIHLPRAVVTFKQEGYAITAAHAVQVAPIERRDPSTRIVRRLWYYRYPLAHRGYERLALAMTTLRMI